MKSFPHTPMHATVTANTITETPYPLCVGHTMPDGSMSALSLFITRQQAVELLEKLPKALEELDRRIEAGQ